MRKSVLGTRGIKPIRMGEDPISPDVSPRMKLGAQRATPHRDRVSAIRMCDLTLQEQSVFLSSKKKVDRTLLFSSKKKVDQSRVHSSKKKVNQPSRTLKSPKMRRCLQYRDEINEKPKTQIPVTSKRHIAQNVQQRQIPEIVVQRPESSIPRAGRTRKSKSTAASINVVGNDKAPSGTEYLELFNHLKQTAEEQTNILIKIADILQGIVGDQKKVFQQATGAFSQMLLEQRNFIEAFKGSLQADRTRKIAENSRRASDEEFSALETLLESKHTSRNSQSVNVTQKKTPQKRSKSLVCGKENSAERPTRKSLAAYREMRKSFSCLGTPASARKVRTTMPRTPRTPRSMLSAKVQSQLKNLLDD